MTPLLDAGRVFAAVPPLHRLEIVRPGAKNEIRYTYSDEEMNKLVSGSREEGTAGQGPDPAGTRVWARWTQVSCGDDHGPDQTPTRRVTVSDASSASNDVFRLLMGNEVAPRKGFIVESSEALDRALLDV